MLIGSAVFAGCWAFARFAWFRCLLSLTVTPHLCCSLQMLVPVCFLQNFSVEPGRQNAFQIGMALTLFVFR